MSPASERNFDKVVKPRGNGRTGRFSRCRGARHSGRAGAISAKPAVGAGLRMIAFLDEANRHPRRPFRRTGAIRASLAASHSMPSSASACFERSLPEETRLQPMTAHPPLLPRREPSPSRQTGGLSRRLGNGDDHAARLPHRRQSHARPDRPFGVLHPGMARRSSPVSARSHRPD